MPYSNHVTTKNKVPSPFSKCPLEDDIKFIENTRLYNSQARNHLSKASFPFFFFFQVVLLELSLNKSQLKWDNHIFRVDWQILNKQWRVDRIYIILYICILFKLQSRIFSDVSNRYFFFTSWLWGQHGFCQGSVS